MLRSETDIHPETEWNDKDKEGKQANNWNQEHKN